MSSLSTLTAAAIFLAAGDAGPPLRPERLIRKRASKKKRRQRKAVKDAGRKSRSK